MDSARTESANALAQLGSKDTELIGLQEAKKRIDEQFAAESASVKELQQQSIKVTSELEAIKSQVR